MRIHVVCILCEVWCVCVVCSIIVSVAVYVGRYLERRYAGTLNVELSDQCYLEKHKLTDRKKQCHH